MHLPVPNREEVEKFAEIYERRLGVKLSGEEALDAATRLLQLAVLLESQGRRVLPRRSEQGEQTPIKPLSSALFKPVDGVTRNKS